MSIVYWMPCLHSRDATVVPSVKRSIQNTMEPSSLGQCDVAGGGGGDVSEAQGRDVVRGSGPRWVACALHVSR